MSSYRPRALRFTPAALLIATLALALPAGASAATIEVGTVADEGDDCTLRSAIMAASDNAAVSGCVAGSASATDRIEFAVSGIIELDDPLPPINGDLVIDGPGAGALTVTNPTPDPLRILMVFSGSEVEIEGLTIANGRVLTGSAAGGGIYNSGDLTLRSVHVLNNTVTDNETAAWANSFGGGVFSDGSLTIVDSELTGNQANTHTDGSSDIDGVAVGRGSAVYATGDLTIRGTEISGNSIAASSPFYAAGYGTVFSSGTTTIANSTIANNTIVAAGGTASGQTFGSAIAHSPFGGQALTLDQVTIDANDSTVSGSFVSDGAERGGVYVKEAPATINSSTLTESTADAGPELVVDAAGQTVTVKNSIIADQNGAGNPCALGPGTLVSGGFNLIETGAASCFASPLTSDIGGDPLLGALADNGAAVRTKLPGPTSPAIDAGVDASALGSDERGQQRPRDLATANATGGDGSDIGAAERQTTLGSPQSIDFGPVAPGGSSSIVPVTFSREDDAGTYFFGTAAISGPDASDFTKDDNFCSGYALANLVPTCQLFLRFAPAGDAPPGEHTATLTLADTTSATPITIELRAEVTDVDNPTTQVTGLKLKKRTATLRFSGSDEQPGLITFQCSLDGKPFSACKSPKVYKRLKFGKHTFKVRSRDGYGNLDPSPAVKRFKIKKPR